MTTIVRSLIALSLGSVLCGAAGLTIEKSGTELAYFAHNGKPLLSFGGLSDFVFYANRDAYDYRLWADWAAEHGLNHVRAYPPLSWQHVEAFTRLNGGSVDQALFPYEEVSPGSRRFDLERFSEAYWQRFRKQIEYFESKGVIVHLLMWNGWQLRSPVTHRTETARFDWYGHFFNPVNNINEYTKHLGPNEERRYDLYHSVADEKTKLATAQEKWFLKLVEETAGFDNVYYDLAHEMAEHQGEWSKVQAWIEAMAKAIRRRYGELQPGRRPILGMDSGGLSAQQREWLFSRDYFDVLIYGKKHIVSNAIDWRKKYGKPYIPQESWDDHGKKYSYLHPEQRVATRKYMWKFVMAKCQQLDLYMKVEGFPQPTKYIHNYDPRGHNEFEKDAKVLRRFWDSLIDYPNLAFRGRVGEGPGAHRYVLSSEREAVAYCSSATAREGVRFPAGKLRLEGLALMDGRYKAEFVDPEKGLWRTAEGQVTRGALTLDLPAFTDDIAVHLIAR